MSKSEVEQTRQRVAELSKLLVLPPTQLAYWHRRWLDEVVAAHHRMDVNQLKYYSVRVLILIGGAITPALVGLNLSGFGGQLIQWITLGLTVVSALAIGLHDLFAPGERWRTNRSYFPLLYAEGVQFATLSGRYETFTGHEAAFSQFSARLEEIIAGYEAEYSKRILQPVSRSGQPARDVEDAPRET